LRLSSAIRASAWAVVAAGVAAPIVRRRVRLPPPAVPAIAGLAPVALCVAVRRSRMRDFATCALQMWAYVYAYKTPHDDPAAQAARAHVDYPLAVDRVLGLGETPTLRLQRALGRPAEIRPFDKPLVWTHWMWFMVPHGALLYLLLRRPQQFERGAVMMYAAFDLGAIVYHLAPTAPPWWATDGEGEASGRGQAHEPVVRRMMAEYGEQFWRDRWGPLYSVLGGNPLAAMPSLHFATSVMAAHLLREAGPLQGALGWTYAATLGFALVYLGEHYVVDLLAGLALTEGVRALAPRAAPLAHRVSAGIQALEARASA
jgi:membrane-associated phospholipid phosphatase